MKTIEVYIDLENIGLAYLTEHSAERVRLMAPSLRKRLEADGYLVKEVFCFASYRKGRVYNVTPRQIQRRFCATMKANGWRMMWSRDIADNHIINTICDRLVNSRLSEAVMFMTNDHDYINVTRQLQQNGRDVLVCGPTISKRLEAAATKIIPYLELAGSLLERNYDIPFEILGAKTVLPNRIPLPDLKTDSS